ncbi:MAG: replication protein [Bacilli bacterium]|nr:replication protein [Bacilli bacterium]
MANLTILKKENSYNKFIIIINYPKVGEVAKNEATAWFIAQNLNRDYCCRYAYIHHDSDLKETGEPKTFHTHLVIWKTFRVRKSTLIKYISSHNDIPANCLSIEPCSNVSSMIRYLIHQDTPEKYRYLKEDIITNCDEEVSQALNYIQDDISSETLEYIFQNCEYQKKRVAEELGPSKYCRWRSYIELFCK